jgi:hypothetical protein
MIATHCCALNPKQNLIRISHLALSLPLLGAWEVGRTSVCGDDDHDEKAVRPHYDSSRQRIYLVQILRDGHDLPRRCTRKPFDMHYDRMSSLLDKQILGSETF